MSSRRLPSPRNRAVSLSVLCAVLALALAGPSVPTAMSAGLGANNSLSELTGGQEPTPTQTTATTASTESTSSSNSSTVVILALAAAAVLLLAIAAVIIRDARRVAPVAEGQLATGGSTRDSAARLRRRRAKAKAARRQRKRNR